MPRQAKADRYEREVGVTHFGQLFHTACNAPTAAVVSDASVEGLSMSSH